MTFRKNLSLPSSGWKEWALAVTSNRSKLWRNILVTLMMEEIRSFETPILPIMICYFRVSIEKLQALKVPHQPYTPSIDQSEYGSQITEDRSKWEQDFTIFAPCILVYRSHYWRVIWSRIGHFIRVKEQSTAVRQRYGLRENSITDWWEIEPKNRQTASTSILSLPIEIRNLRDSCHTISDTCHIWTETSTWRAVGSLLNYTATLRYSLYYSVSTRDMLTRIRIASPFWKAAARRNKTP
jgi:hypothetical protein